MSVTVGAPRDDRASVDKAFDILLAFGDHGHTGLGVSELARRAGLSKSTVFRLLGMLERNGVVERHGRSYRLGARLHHLGTRVYAPGHDAVRDLLTPFLAELFVHTHETVHLAVLHGDAVLFLGKLFGHHGVPVPSRVGQRAPAYCTAAGKALLAFTPDDAAGAPAPRRAWTPRTLVNPDELRAALAGVRATGLATDDEEWRPGLRCLATPVSGPDGLPVAALSISASADSDRLEAHSATLRRISHAAGLAVSRSGRLRSTRPPLRPEIVA